jgi:hypothetical protein
MFGRITLRELIRSQHEESLRYQEQRAEEWRKRDAEFQEEARQRAEEARQRAEESRQREARLEQLAEETREYNREMLLRNEKVYKAVIAEVEEGRRQIAANTQAVLSVLDRLEGSSGTAAA